MKSFTRYNGISRESAQTGYTIIEIMVVVSIFSLLAWGFTSFTSSLIIGGSKQSELSGNTDEARKISVKLMNELRESTASNTGNYALGLANAQEIIFYSNIDGGTDIERLRYYISNGKLYRGVVKPTGTPYAYNLGSETSTVVQNNLANGANPLFYYFDGSYDGVSGSALSQPVNITSVRMVQMELRVTNKAGKVGTNYYTINSFGTIRNLKSNLDD